MQKILVGLRLLIVAIYKARIDEFATIIQVLEGIIQMNSASPLLKFLKLSVVLMVLTTAFTANASFPFVFGGVNDKDPGVGKNIDSNSDNPHAMTIGGNDILYIGGDFLGENINFSANFSMNSSLVTSTLEDGDLEYSDDGFIAAYKANSDLQWVVAIQGRDSDRVWGIASDDTGNVYATGRFRSTGAGDMKLNRISTAGVVTPLATFSTADDGYKAFIMKLSPTGALIWFKVLDGNQAFSYSFGQSIDVDNSGNVYVGGGFSDDIDFDPSINGSTVIKSNNDEFDWKEDGFVLKLSATGELQWVKTLGGAQNDSVRRVVVDSANNVLYLAGRSESDFAGINLDGNIATLEFDSTPAAGLVDGSGTDSGDDFSFVQKLNAANGNLIWNKAFLADVSNDDSDNSISAIAVNFADGSLFVTGYFDDTVDFNPASNVSHSSSSQTGDEDLFFVKLDTNGNYLWHGVLGNPAGSDEGPDAIHFGNNKLYISGDYSGAALVGSGTAANIATWDSMIPHSNGGQDALMLQLDPVDGDFIWARNFGGTDYDTGDSFAQDSQNNVYFAGQFRNTIDLDPTVGVINFTAQDGVGTRGRDAFVVKLTENGGLIVPQTSQPPVAVAKAIYEYVQQNQWGKIDGAESYDLNGEAISFEWKQIAGPRLTILNSDDDELTFIAPFVTANVSVTVELVVSNSSFSSEPIQVTFTVGPDEKLVVAVNGEEVDSDGGSMGIFALSLLTLMAIRRKFKMTP